MAVKIWLADKSALVKLGGSKDAPLWAERINRGLVRISSITRLEIGYSARSEKDLTNSFASPPLSNLIVELLSPSIEARAWEVMQKLAAIGAHRAPSIPDLLIAATAERCQYTLLHVDKDFELISTITSQPLERLS